MVDCAGKVYKLELNRRGNRPGESAMLVVDGQEALPLTREHRITFRRAPVNFRLIKLRGRTYYQTLHSKLRWGERPQYRQEPSSPQPRKE